VSAVDPSQPERSEPPVTRSQKTVASQSSTGIFKQLTTSDRLARLWARLGLQLGRSLASVVRDDHVFLIVMAAVVGTASGVAAGALLAWIAYAITLFPQPEDGNPWLRWLVVLGVPVVGGLLAGVLHLLVRRVLRQKLVMGVPAVIEAVALRGGTIRGRQAVITGLGTGITIGSGGSCGHEGPSVAIGAAVGSVLARFFGMRARWHLSMVGAGCAGGLAAAFNAPLAGVIFAVEVVFGGAIGGNVGTMSVFVPLIVAAVAGTFTSHAIRGETIVFSGVSHGDAILVDLAFFLLLAALAGVVGTAMGRCIIRTGSWFEALEIPTILKPAVGALGVGLLAALVSNELLGAGHSTVSAALDGALAWKLALVLSLLKIVATAMTVGSGGFGGVFMPSLYIGACLGTLVGTLAFVVVGPGAESTGAYALVGMGALFAATMHAPLTPIVMIFELTRDYALILPLMLACILSVFVARRIYPYNFFKDMLHAHGVILGHDAEVEVMKRGHVSELMLRGVGVLAETADYEEVRRAVLAADMRATFVVDAGGTVVGFVNGNQLARKMLTGDVSPASTARDIMGEGLPFLHETDTLAGAILASARSGMEVLPVVDVDRRLVGIVRRGDLMAHYSDKVLGQQEEAMTIHAGDQHDHEVGLGKGVILDHIVVGRRWAGRTLADLNVRGQTGVTVLEWARGDTVLPIDPKAPLHESDVLAVAGSREQLLHARRL